MLMLMLFYSIKLRNQTTLQGTPEFQKGSSYNDTTLQQKIKKKLKIIIYYKKKNELINYEIDYEG